MNLLLFYILAIMAGVSALMVVTLKNIFHSALFLVLTLFSIAGIYLLLGAEFLAGVQVLIYVGAITILMIFAIMLTYQISNKSISKPKRVPMPYLCLAKLRFGTTRFRDPGICMIDPWSPSIVVRLRPA